ncbi:PREDICTED: probable F-box protein At5g04010 [Tarenaya hassleriana]|uniref:probable F-box protein At5g04010 n=1 Tax=Tarenaya hassleriana TaxID=28532 RepID=UPI00053C0CAA|nr:PREDICTED: probable F-box protein At5g04010 [Tarenaya hassleriana]
MDVTGVLSTPPQKHSPCSQDSSSNQNHEASSMSDNVQDSGDYPAWEVLSLAADHMDGETLAMASCVSKTWRLCFSSENLWRSLFVTHHPSLYSAMTKMTTSSSSSSPEISYRRLCYAAESAAKRRRSVRQPAKPKITLSDLTFIVHVRNSDMNLTMEKHGKDIAVPSDGLFRFNIDVTNLHGSNLFAGDMKEARVTWHVVYREWESVFTMTDGIRSLEKEKWFTDELPPPEFSIFSRGSGLAADVALEITGGNQSVKVEKMVLGIMNTVDLRYLNLDDGLRYLERFLLEQGRE